MSALEVYSIAHHPEMLHIIDECGRDQYTASPFVLFLDQGELRGLQLFVMFHSRLSAHSAYMYGRST